MVADEARHGLGESRLVPTVGILLIAKSNKYGGFGGYDQTFHLPQFSG